MEFSQVIARRYSCRRYSERPVPRELLIRCMEAGRLSPSACNSQRWLFIAVDEAEKRRLVAEALHDPEMGVNTFAHKVPAFIVIVNHPARELNEKQKTLLSRDDFSSIDIGIAAQQICLAATDLGLGSVMMGWLEKDNIRAALGIPEQMDVPLVIGLGYPQQELVKQPIRYEMSDVTRFNSFSGE